MDDGESDGEDETTAAVARAAFLAGFALAREGRTHAELQPVTRRTAEARFERWYEQYDRD